MITKNTVFILGAGASSDFGFPLGEKLRQEIIQRFIENHSQTYEDIGNVAKVLCGEWPEDFKDYVSVITEFAYKLKHNASYSIDEFLERFKEAYLLIGKLAIALILTKYENHNLLYDSDNWYKRIYRRMGQSAEIDTFHQNKVSFITFNYDRSLEHFLYTSLSNFHEKMTENRAKEIISQIPIVHIYGQLDPLPWQDSRGRAYGSPITLGQLKRYTENMSIIFENMTEKINSNFQKAIDLLKQAERVYILGFGFHPINMDRLKLNEIKEKRIIATSYGIDSEQMRSIRGCLTLSGYPSITFYSSHDAKKDITKGTKLYNMSVYDLISKFATLD